jgi:hypothetical protein
MFSVTGGVAALAGALEPVAPVAADPGVVCVTLGLIRCFLLLPARRRGSSKRGQKPCEVLSLFFRLGRVVGIFRVPRFLLWRIALVAAAVLAGLALALL